MEKKILELMDRFDEGNMSINDLEQELLVLYSVMPRISHFVSEIGQKYPANDEAVLIEIKDGYLRFYELGYDFERIYLTPVYGA